MARHRSAEHFWPAGPRRPRAARSNGVAAGYFIVADRVSLGAALHNPRFLSTPVAVAKDASLRDNVSAAAGVRLYVPAGKGMMIRPGLSYGLGLAGALADNKHQMVQLDLPVSF